MPILASRCVSDAKGDFKGGNALSVNWDTLLRRAAQNLLLNINVDVLKLRRPVYGGITQDAAVHYMPSEIVKPVSLYKNDGERSWDYVSPKAYFAKAQTDVFTVQSINGVRFLIVGHNESSSRLILDEMEDITGIGGTATPVLNSQDFLAGSASVQASFTDAGLTLTRTLDEALDLTDYLQGVLLVPIRLADKNKIASIVFRLQTDTSNYYQVTTAADSISDYLVNGWNYLTFELKNRTQVGTPDDTNIASWLAIITTTTGQTQTVVLDQMTIQKTAPLWLEGYSNKLFIDATTGASKSTVDYSAGDSVNIEEELSVIFHYELCLLIEQSAYSSEDRDTTSSFAGQLKRAYANYYENHPSEEEPISYNILPELNRETDPFTDRSTI